MAIFSYWMIALVPLLLMRLLKDRWTDYGFRKTDRGRQVLTGLGIALAMSLVLTVLPHLVGLGDWVDNGTRTLVLWKILFNFVYFIVAVGAVEEFIFRGFLYRRLQLLFNSEAVAIVGSSILFGTFHLFHGNVAQLIMTTLIGILFCVLRRNSKSCTTLSLIIAHGVYDALIGVWASLL